MTNSCAARSALRSGGGEREVPDDGNVLILAMIPHPYHLTRRFTLASPLEQGAIDYRRLETVDDFQAASGAVRRDPRRA